MSILKYPLQFGADKCAVLSDNPAEQFKVFTTVEPGTYLYYQDYGLNYNPFLQTPISSLVELSQLYSILLRNKFIRYLRSINIIKSNISYNRREKSIIITVYYRFNGVITTTDWTLSA